MHPNATALIAFCDGEAAGLRGRWIARHVDRCTRCREEARRIRTEKHQLLAVTGTPDFAPGLDRLLSAASEWRAGNNRAAQLELRNGVRTQIELYFGAPALSVMEKPGMPAQELFARTHDLMEAFLGPEAAEAVREDVLLGMDCSTLSEETQR
jgi:hypothetical protein